MAHQHQHHSVAGPDESAMAEILDLDAEVLHPYLSGVLDWVQELAADLPRRRIVDLGSGTGTGTLALLERFEAAEVIALDHSAALLDRLREKARAHGVTGRLSLVQADLDEAWPAVGTVDLVWASNSMHHLADPDRVLGEVLAALRPGGLLVVAELESFPRFLPDDVGLGRPGLEARCYAAVAEQRAVDLPHLGADWGSRLTRAGFSVDAERMFDIDLAPPLPAATGRYAQACLARIRTGLADRLSADDLATLDLLVDGDAAEGVLRRDDLTVRTTRTVWVARRLRS